MDNLQSSDKLINELTATLENEIKALEQQQNVISFEIKAKKAKLRKYKAINEPPKND